jgi:cation transport ATPase
MVFFLPIKLPWEESYKLLIFLSALSTSLWVLSLILGRIESESVKKLCVLFLNIMAFTASIMYILAFFVLAYFLYPFLFRAVIKIFSWGAHSIERFLIICIILVLIASTINDKDEENYFDSDYL